MSFLKSLFSSNKSEDNATETDNKKFQTLKYDGVRAKNMGELPLALKFLEEALSLKTDDAETMSYLVEIYMSTGHAEKALSLIKPLLDIEPNNISLLFAQAQAAERINDFETMAEACKKAIAVDATNVSAIYLLARAYKGQKNEILSVAELTKALTIKPDYQPALLLRAQTLLLMNQYAEAEKDINQFLEAEPDSEEALILKADIRSLASDEEEAEKYYKKALEANPFSEEAILKLGELYIKINQLDKALALLDDIISSQPTIAAAYKQRGLVKRLLKDDIGAMEDLKQAIELSPKEAKEIDGEFSNIENAMENHYRRLNPYGF